MSHVYTATHAPVHGATGLPRTTELRAADLTPMQGAVAQMAAEGLSNKEIGRIKGITEGTVKVHLKTAMRKCRLSSRTGLVRLFPSTAAEKEDITLNGRESQVLKLVAEGKKNKEIANEIGISECTVKTYVKSLLAKLRLPNRTAAARWYVAQQAVVEG